MEKNPEKKEEYMIANNVLKLALDLLKVRFIEICFFFFFKEKRTERNSYE